MSQIDDVYKGWELRWTGWKNWPDKCEFVGQWLALDRSTGIRLYSSYPGGAGIYNPHETFDTARREQQCLLTPWSTLEELAAACKQARCLLLQFIDAAAEA